MNYIRVKRTDGIVVRLNLDPIAYIREFDDYIRVVFADVNRLWLDLDISEKDTIYEALGILESTPQTSEIEESNDQIDDTTDENDEKIGYKDDKIFLLPVEEYKRLKDVIPHQNCLWWLRSPGINLAFATYVYEDGSVSYYGTYVDYVPCAVRPVIKTYQPFEEIGETFCFNNYAFTKITEDLAIATVPIAFARFDESSNDYETSEIRKKLLKWYETGEWE